VALLEKAAGQGHAYAMEVLGCFYREKNVRGQALEWYTKGAEAGLPLAMHNLAWVFDAGMGVAAPDYPAAAKWYKRAAEGGHGNAASNLANMYTLGRGRARRDDACLPRHLPHFRPSFLDVNGIT